MSLSVVVLLVWLSLGINIISVANANILEAGLDVLFIIAGWADWMTRYHWSQVCRSTRIACDLNDFLSMIDTHSLITHPDWTSNMFRCIHEHHLLTCFKSLTSQSTHYTKSILFCNQQWFRCQGGSSKNKPMIHSPATHTEIGRFTVQPWMSLQHSLQANWLCLSDCFRFSIYLIHLKKKLHIHLTNYQSIKFVSRRLAIARLRCSTKTKFELVSIHPKTGIRIIIQRVDLNQLFEGKMAKLGRWRCPPVEVINGKQYRIRLIVHTQCDLGGYYISTIDMLKGTVISNTPVSIPTDRSYDVPFSEDGQCMMSFDILNNKCSEPDTISSSRIGIKLMDTMTGDETNICPMVWSSKLGFMNERKDFYISPSYIGSTSNNEVEWLLYNLKDRVLSGVINCCNRPARFITWFSDDLFGMEILTSEFDPRYTPLLFSVHHPNQYLEMLPLSFGGSVTFGRGIPQTAYREGSQIVVVKWNGGN